MQANLTFGASPTVIWNPAMWVAHNHAQFRAWAEQFMQTRLNLAPSTFTRDQTYVNRMLIPYLGERRLAAMTPILIQEWVAALSKEYAPATVRKAYQLANPIFRSAVDSDILTRSPCRGVSLPRQTRTEKRFLSPGEVDRLVDAVDDRYRALVLLAAQTGMRWGEVAGLRIGNLDMLRRRVSVVETLVEVRGTHSVGQPKTAASRRTIVLPRGLVDRLALHLAEYPPVDGHVFTTPTGDLIRRQTCVAVRGFLR